MGGGPLARHPHGGHRHGGARALRSAHPSSQCPIDGNRQSAGILHGGASAALAETAASFAAQIHARETHPGKQAYAVGTELNASHIAAGREGTVTATATAVHLGRSSTVHTVEIHDEADRLISIARVANRILVRSTHD